MSDAPSAVDWTGDLSVNVKLIDDEHKMLLSVYNDLVESLQRHDQAAVVDKVMKELFAYTQYHFGHEDELMSSYGYDDIEAHRAQHAGFVDRLHAMEQSIAAGQDTAEHLAEFVRSWITGHIKVADRKLGTFLKDRLPPDGFDFANPEVGVVP